MFSKAEPAEPKELVLASSLNGHMDGYVVICSGHFMP